MTDKITEMTIYYHIKEILEKAKHKTYVSINFAMVEAYWEIGKALLKCKVVMKLLNMAQTCYLCYQKN